MLISDIPGDDPALIASGATLPDTTTCEDALAVLKRYVIKDTPHVNHALSTSAWESIKPGATRLSRNTHQVVACAWDGLLAAKHQAGTDGLKCHIISDAMEGEARDLALSHAAIALRSQTTIRHSTRRDHFWR